VPTTALSPALVLAGEELEDARAVALEGVVLAAAEFSPGDRSGFEGRHIEEAGERLLLLERLGRPGQLTHGAIEGPRWV
jgi:hypothetical protein